MGRVKFGSGVQQILGSVGGVTFSQVASVPTARGWRRPVNKRTQSQRTKRANFATFSSQWFATMTQVQRTGWSTYADTVTFLNLFGDTYKISGFQMWMRTALLISKTPNPVILTPPVIPGLPAARTLPTSLVHATGVFSVVSVTPPGLAADRLEFFTFPFDRSTRGLPRSKSNASTGVAGNTATPFDIRTYGALPGVAGNYQAYSNFIFMDSDNRVTNQQLLSAISA